jgi:catechol 2,3-dioxygenase-like lactoylglutathione lyase family enzyme
MINGAHVIIYSTDAEADREFFRDVLGLSHVDVGDGWLIFGLPPSEVAVHPTGGGMHEGDESRGEHNGNGHGGAAEEMEAGEQESEDEGFAEDEGFSAGGAELGEEAEAEEEMEAGEDEEEEEESEEEGGAEGGRHELYLMCDDIESFVSEVGARSLECSPVQDQGWGLLTQITLPGGGRLGVYQPRHARPPTVEMPGEAGKAAKRPAKKAVKKAAKKAAKVDKKAAKKTAKAQKKAAKKAGKSAAKSAKKGRR